MDAVQVRLETVIDQVRGLWWLCSRKEAMARRTQLLVWAVIHSLEQGRGRRFKLTVTFREPVPGWSKGRPCGRNDLLEGPVSSRAPRDARPGGQTSGDRRGPIMAMPEEADDKVVPMLDMLGSPASRRYLIAWPASGKPPPVLQHPHIESLQGGDHGNLVVHGDVPRTGGIGVLLDGLRVEHPQHSGDGLLLRGEGRRERDRRRAS